MYIRSRRIYIIHVYFHTSMHMQTQSKLTTRCVCVFFFSLPYACLSLSIYIRTWRVYIRTQLFFVICFCFQLSRICTQIKLHYIDAHAQAHTRGIRQTHIKFLYTRPHARLCALASIKHLRTWTEAREREIRSHTLTPSYIHPRTHIRRHTYIWTHHGRNSPPLPRQSFI